MADISQITLPDGTTYDIKDPVARAAAGDAGAGKIFYGVCSTGASTQTKVVTIEDFELFTGALIAVKFDNVNTATAPKLNISGTGAINMYSVGTTAVLPNAWSAGETLLFVYNGTSYVVADGGIASTSNYGETKLNSAVDSTSTTEAATPSAVKQAYDLANSKQNALTFDAVPTSGSTNPVTSGGIYTELETVKTSVSNGKSAIASAITDKGVSTSGSDSFATMASNIALIQTDSFDITNWKVRNASHSNINANLMKDLIYNHGYYVFLLYNNNTTYLSYFDESALDNNTLTFSYASFGTSSYPNKYKALTCSDGMAIYMGYVSYTTGVKFVVPNSRTNLPVSTNVKISFADIAYGASTIVTHENPSKYIYYYNASLHPDATPVFTSLNVRSSGNLYVNEVKYVNGRFFIICEGTSSGGGLSFMYLSDYGTSFTANNLGTAETWTDVAYGKMSNGDNCYIIISSGSNLYAHSNSGDSNWYTSSLPISHNWTYIIFANDVFIAFTNNSTYAAYSTDGGTNWILFTMPISNCRGVAFSGNRIVTIHSTSSTVTSFAFLDLNS